MKTLDDTMKNMRNNSFKLRKIFASMRFDKILFGFAFCALSVMFCHHSTAQALSLTVNNRTTGENISYQNRIVKNVVNGAQITLGGTPGLILNGVAMAPYDLVYNDAMGLTCFYDERTGDLMIQTDTITLEMKLGSKNAYVNETKILLAAAPVELSFQGSPIRKIYVPTRSVTEALGYSHVWDNETATTYMKKVIPFTVDGQTLRYCDTLFHASINGENIEFDITPGFYYKNIPMFRIKQLFEVALNCSYKKAGKQITLTKGDIQIVMQLGNKEIKVNDCTFVMEVPPIEIVNQIDGNAYICVPIESICNYLGFSYSFDALTQNYSIVQNSATGNAKQNALLSSYISFDDYFSRSKAEEATVVHPYFTWEPSDAYLQIFHEKKNPITEITENSSEKEFYRMIGDTSYMTDYGIQQFSLSYFPSIYQMSVAKIKSGFRLNFSHMYSPNFSSEVYADVPFSKAVAKLSMSGAFAGLSVSLEKDTNTDETINYVASLSHDKSTKSVYLNIFPSYLHSFLGYGIGDKDVLFVGMDDLLKPSVTVNGNEIVFTFRNRYFSEQEEIFEIENGTVIKNCRMLTQNGTTTLTVSLKANFGYQIFPTSDGIYICLFPKQLQSVLFSEIMIYNENEPLYHQNEMIYVFSADVSSMKLFDRDDYKNKTIYLYAAGDYTDAINHATCIAHLGVVSDVSCSYISSMNLTEIKIVCKKIQAYSYTLENNMLRIKIGDPDEIFDKIIVLDPGHGGDDAGAAGGEYHEADLVLQIIRDYAAPLFAQSDIKVYYTRLTDEFIPLMDRATFSGQVGADLFISLHMNASATSPEASGISVYYYDVLNITNKQTGLTSATLAQTLLDTLFSPLSLRNRGVRSDEFTVITYNTVPSILIELGFITNPEERDRLVSTEFEQEAAELIFQAVNQLFEKYPTNR